MSNTRHIALRLAVLAALALTAGRAAATMPDTSRSADEITSMSSDITGDTRPPTTGPTNPARHGA